MGRTFLFCNSQTELYTKMHIRQLVWLVALCALMSAVHSAAVDSELASKADVATTDTAGVQRGWQNHFNSKTLKLTRSNGYKSRIYWPRKCELIKTKMGRSRKYMTFKCKMCRRRRRSRRYNDCLDGIGMQRVASCPKWSMLRCHTAKAWIGNF